MSKKITWDEIYQDFKRRHPHLAKHALYYIPCDCLKIRVYMDDRTKMEYDYFNFAARFIA